VIVRRSSPVSSLQALPALLAGPDDREPDRGGVGALVEAQADAGFLEVLRPVLLLDWHVAFLQPFG